MCDKPVSLTTSKDLYSTICEERPYVVSLPVHN
jgi:hypothetical protein